MAYKSNLNNILSTLSSTKKDVCNSWGTTLVAEYKARTPVVSGNMRKAETFDTLGNNEGIQIGTTPQADYALYVEEGSSKQPAQHILRDTILDNINTLQSIAKNKISSSMDKE